MKALFVQPSNCWFIHSLMILFIYTRSWYSSWSLCIFRLFQDFCHSVEKYPCRTKWAASYLARLFELVHHYMKMFAVWGWVTDCHFFCNNSMGGAAAAFNKHKTRTISKLKSNFKHATNTSTNLVCGVSHFLDSKLRPVVNLLFAGQWTGGESSINQQRTSAVTSISARSGIIQQIMIFVDLVLDGEKIWKIITACFK